jgi:methyl-accepting chemotaxis protein
MAGPFRFKKSIIKTNPVFSLLFGILMGILFPFYASLFVDFRSHLLLGFFIVGCIIAGIAVGTIAFLITRFTIVKVIRLVANELSDIASGQNSSGPGFKVIASEIRGLARNAETMTTDIGRILDTVTNGITVSVKNLDKSKEQFTGIVSGIKETSRELLGDVESIQKITGDVEQNYSRIREMLVSVKNNMEKLKQTSVCFSESLGNLNRLSEVIKQGVAEIHSGSHEINEITENTLRVAENLKRTCNTIDEQVKQYNTSGDKHEKNR